MLIYGPLLFPHLLSFNLLNSPSSIYSKTMNSTPPEESIRHRAYLLWEADGRPDGRDEHYWQLASSQLRNGTTAPAPDGAVADPRTVKSRTPKKSAPLKKGKRQSADEASKSAPGAKLQGSAAASQAPASTKAASKKTKAQAKKAQRGGGSNNQVEA
ncbi:hypothetical protein AWB82_07184 [Caballeronia glebae]|uniref:DUF2934 domain-containing protein n=2 Tax=Caballeronia glebae TaxID=1777143 RepID=A0A158DWJ4_9BURK|nr:hypothetical protein AWB82_07184 [Caballeronia glebae]